MWRIRPGEQSKLVGTRGLGVHTKTTVVFMMWSSPLPGDMAGLPPITTCREGLKALLSFTVSQECREALGLRVVEESSLSSGLSVPKDQRMLLPSIPSSFLRTVLSASPLCFRIVLGMEWRGERAALVEARVPVEPQRPKSPGSGCASKASAKVQLSCLPQLLQNGVHLRRAFLATLLHNSNSWVAC